MSKGLGKVQRSILASLKDKAWRSDYIACVVYQTETPTPAQIVSTRRAINKLAEAGLVECAEYISSTDNDIRGAYLYAWLPGHKPKEHNWRAFLRAVERGITDPQQWEAMGLLDGASPTRRR